MFESEFLVSVPINSPFKMAANTKHDGIHIRIMTEKDYEEIKELIFEDYFTGVPLCLPKSKFTTETKELLDGVHRHMVAQDTCLVAIDEVNNGRLVAFALAGAQFPEDLEKQRNELDRIQPELAVLLRFLHGLECQAGIFKRYGVTKLIYSCFTYVNPEMRGRRLGVRLAEAVMELGRSKGFPLMTACCVSFYSARQKEALGMECILSQSYADYKDDQGQEIFTPPAPHKEVRILAIRLINKEE
ncbi:arylalkylamine N-acetyltransferase-like 2 [Drosophila kikkawai]|uniref:Arylalkylamine N-acetyltransferase-like 2 n=1 Tax=Drosophila kikkawai TaxID=30033 RepID=A0ABM3C5J7_DROKI|nr:dopamine N-acetyltransferase-like [Drosophila kikkawai]